MAYAETDTCWHLLVRTEGGKVSMLKNLDAPTARKAYQRLKPDTHPRRYLNRPENGGVSWSGGCHTVSNSDIRMVDILGPEECDLEPWRGVEPRYYDLSADLRYGPRPLAPEIGRAMAAEEDARKSERAGA